MSRSFRLRRLVFDFGVPKYTTEKTRVTIEIAPEASGCQLTLTHDGVWADYESRTETRLEHAPRRPDRHAPIGR